MLAKKKNVELTPNHINSNHNNKSNAVSKWKGNRQGSHAKRKNSKRIHSRLSKKEIRTEKQANVRTEEQTKAKEETVEYGYFHLITQKHPRLHQHPALSSKHANVPTLYSTAVDAGSSTALFAWHEQDDRTQLDRRFVSFFY